MPKTVVICEKSSQAKDLKVALGNKYGQILPARGHILTLKEPDEVREEWNTKTAGWSAGLLWPGQFYPKKPVADARSLLSAIRNAISDADEVIIATDCDREGQLIGDEILEYLRFNGKVKRAMFTAQDPVSLRKAFDNLEDNSVYHGRYMAGQAREQADQTTNLSLTRTATVTLKKPGSGGAIGIGRVKTPVLGIVCKRELEIMNFKPHDMFEVDADTEVENGTFKLSCTKMPASVLKELEKEEAEAEEDDLEEGEEALQEMDSLRGKIMDKRIADGLVAAAKGHEGPLNAKFEKKRQGPPKLFDLTALSAACSSRFGWGGDQTLAVAQSLYAAPHHILTYPRGEAQYLPENEIPNVPEMVKRLLRMPAYGKHGELLAKPQVRKGKSGHFSDAGLKGFSHYAIIPNINAPKAFHEVWPNLSSDQKKMFDLVSKQYLAAMAPDFEYRQTTVDMTVPWRGHNWSFKNSGRVPLVPGWKEILGSAPAKPGEDNDFPQMKNGEIAKITDAKIRTVTTRPPSRYTEGALQKVMKEAWRLVDDPKQKARLKEATGIGTAATRGEVVAGLLRQKQLMMAGKSVKPTPGGLKLYETLLQACPNVVDPGRTAVWETIFDMVESGKMTAQDALEKINATTEKEIANIRAATVQIEIGTKGKPTPKMVKAAKSIAERKKIKLPPGTIGDSMKCRAFLEEHLGQAKKNADGSKAAYPPSEKQMTLAQNLADRSGKDIPEEAMKSSKELSAWIDKAMKAAPPRPPSEKQLAFAQKLAEENGKELDDAVQNDMKKCSAFIDEHMGKGKKSESASPDM
jgi:DNA topoisomerase-3